MTQTLPKKLKKGDTIGFLAVSGDIKDYSKLEKAKECFESHGYNVIISETAKTRKNYLCADDKMRADALNKFFKSPEIDAIIACRGGYGAIRILDKIDYEAIKENPKMFGGYSDITALQLMIYKKTGLVTFNTPMAYSDFGCGTSDYTKDSFFNVLEQGTKEIVIDNPKIYFNGSTAGVLWGGNLSTIQSLCGLDFVPDKKFILVTEDVNEPVYKIDKMFTQLLSIPMFRGNLAGVVLGNFSGIDNERYFDDFFNELSSGLKIPFISGLKFGHETDKQTFPIGAKVILDTNLSKIFIM